MQGALTCVAGGAPPSCCIEVATGTDRFAWWLRCVPLLPGCGRGCFLASAGPCSSSDPEAECSSSLRKW